MSLPAVIFLATALLTAGFYTWLMQHYRRGWALLPEWVPPLSYHPATHIDVIVPARNEAGGIEACLLSILQSGYPADLYTLTVVDDHSTDDTARIVQTLAEKHPPLRLIRMQDQRAPAGSTAHKKRALTTGIAAGLGELIVCTDADCIVPPHWLHFFSSYYEKHQPVFMAAPVSFYREKRSLEYFQSLDYAGMMLITGAGIQQGWMHMCNGANLAYTRRAFTAVDGFQGIDHLASGDDMLLLQKLVRHFPGRIGFIKSPAMQVKTLPQPNWRAFLRQRLRWASKSRGYPEWRITAALGGVFVFCWLILLSFVLIPWQVGFFLPLGTILLIWKSAVDYFFLRTATHYFGRPELMRHFAISQIYHILYIAAVGLLANIIRTYTWKGRKVR